MTSSRHWRLALPALLLVLPAASAADSVEARCRAIAARTALPPALPPPKGPCDAYALTYGIPGRSGRPPDPKAALACASAADPASEEILGGSAILATLYANGLGVPRDLDRAGAFVCRAGLAEAEQEGMLDALAAMRVAGDRVAPFAVCDHATSALLGTACAARQEADRAARDEDSFADIASTLSAPARDRLAILRDGARAFASAVAGNEVDRSGTAAPVFAIEAERAQADAFLATLMQLLGGTLTAAQPLPAADRALNTAYGRLMKAPAPFSGGTVTRDDVRATQRAWLAYRDRFAAFAALAAPSVPPEVLKAVLTAQRTAQLVALAP